ncbi:MAG: hypothetical protein ACKVJU_04480 [Verrucomicrobiales bacterium]
MKTFRLLLLASVSMFALSSCALLKCDSCTAKQAPARERALQEYQAQQAAVAGASAPAPAAVPQAPAPTPAVAPSPAVVPAPAQ